MRERFDEQGRIVTAAELRLRLVELTGVVRVLDLRLDRNLDALRIDDQINSSRAPEVWSACQRLTDLVGDWYAERCHGIVYRSRTTPQHSANIAFFSSAPLRTRDRGVLQRNEALLTACVHSDGFTIEEW
jgi:hypothetical protein